MIYDWGVHPIAKPTSKRKRRIQKNVGENALNKPNTLNIYRRYKSSPVFGTSIREVHQIWWNLMRLPQIWGLRWGWGQMKNSVRFEAEVWGLKFIKGSRINLNFDFCFNFWQTIFFSLVISSFHYFRTENEKSQNFEDEKIINRICVFSLRNTASLIGWLPKFSSWNPVRVHNQSSRNRKYPNLSI